MTVGNVLYGLLDLQSPEACARRRLATIAMALDNARDYFANRADVKGDAGDIPNEEMTLQIEIEQAQAALKALQHNDANAFNSGR